MNKRGAGMTYRDHYLTLHPDQPTIYGGDGDYPKDKYGGCLCVQDAGYPVKCGGFFDCRDCWNLQYQTNIWR